MLRYIIVSQEIENNDRRRFMQTTVPNFLRQRACLSPTDPAVFIGEQTISFSELDREVQKWAAFLYGTGIRRQMSVAVCMHNSLQLVQIIFALQYIGAVTVFINTRLTESEKLYQLGDSEVKFFLVSDESLAVFSECFVTWILPSEPDVLASDFDLSWLQMEFEMHGVATIMYTSGTTGKPKGVMQTYGNHYHSAIHSLLHMGYFPEDRWLIQLPIFHVSGYSTLMKSVVYGMPIVLPIHGQMEHILDEIQKKKVTLLSWVAKNLQDVFQMQAVHKLTNIRGILLGGGPVPTTILKECHKERLPIYLSYGMTETASQIVTLGGSDVYAKIGSVGKSLFLNQIRIDNQEEPFEVGEILVKGPTVMKGYLNQAEETNRRMTADGYFRTGDMGYFDADGFLYIVDRRNDLIISGGENIYPAEIEAKMMELGIFQEVAVVGMSDAVWGAVPAVFYVPKQPFPYCELDIHNMLKKSLSTYKLPKKYIMLSELPRNALGKIQKIALQNQLKD